MTQEESERVDAARFAEIDLLKGVGIVAVVLIHSLRSVWEPGVHRGEIWLAQLLRFAVPAFFMASGYLYATRGTIDGSTVLRRLRRILVPYLVASLLALLWWSAFGPRLDPRPIWKDLLLGSSFGPFYFVFVLVLFVLVSPLLARLSRDWLLPLLVLLLAAQFLIETQVLEPLPIFWAVRNPFLWAAYFVLGWWARLRRESLVERLGPARQRWLPAVVTVWTLLAAAHFFVEGRRAVGALAWCGILASLLWLYLVGIGRSRAPRSLRVLSDATYTVFLYHLFFVYAAMRLVPRAEGLAPLHTLLYWLVGVTGPLLLLGLLRLAGGRRTKLLLGS